MISSPSVEPSRPAEQPATDGNATETAPATEPLTFGKYQLYERLGEGGMAVVWRAKLIGPRGFEKVLVLKQIRTELSARREFIDLFIAEAKLTVALTHANIVPVYELGMVDGIYFLALELVDGPPLGKLIECGPLDPALAAYIVEQVLRGLDYAHRRGVVHRDLSSANVLVSREGEVKIVDFGIAAPVDARAIGGGSRGYVAPEQEAGSRVDARSDLYAVGVLLGELLTGRHLGGPPAGHLGAAPEPLRLIAERASAADPEARFADAAAMLEAISRYLRETEGATQAGLSAYVRRVLPDVPVTPPSALEAVASGPATVPMHAKSRSGKQITFATRRQPAFRDRRSLARSVAMTLGAVAVLALAALFGARVRDTLASAPLPALPRTAELQLSVIPEGAKVELNKVRIAPGSHEIQPGKYTLTASAPGRQRVRRSFTVQAGAVTNQQLVLEPELGRLSVRTDPPGAMVLRGNDSLGSTPLDTNVPLDGPVALKLKRRDFATIERTLEPSAFTGQPRAATVTERLQPLARGELTLGAIPWAHVTIDGEKQRDTPLSKLPLAAGQHTVKLTCPPTGREFKLIVTIEPGKLTRKVVNLQGEPKLVE